MFLSVSFRVSLCCGTPAALCTQNERSVARRAMTRIWRVFLSIQWWYCSHHVVCTPRCVEHCKHHIFRLSSQHPRSVQCTTRVHAGHGQGRFNCIEKRGSCAEVRVSVSHKVDTLLNDDDKNLCTMETFTDGSSCEINLTILKRTIIEFIIRLQLLPQRCFRCVYHKVKVSQIFNTLNMLQIWL